MSGMQASAATLCVNQNPQSGCPHTTIGAAVAAAASGDTINVAPGRYAEDVHIIQPVSLIGAGAQWTIINAKGLSNGIFIDGINGAATITPGANTLTSVTVTGFTVQNANFEGILALNASNVTLWSNLVAGNDRALDVANSLCPGIPAFETQEGDDCGEGIHLIAVDHSAIANNTAQNNAGGILLSDETGPTNANVYSTKLGSGQRLRLRHHACVAYAGSDHRLSAAAAFWRIRQHGRQQQGYRERHRGPGWSGGGPVRPGTA